MSNNFNSDTLQEILEQLIEIKENSDSLQAIKTEVQNIKASVDANFELLMDKLGTLESILDQIRTNTD